MTHLFRPRTGIQQALPGKLREKIERKSRWLKKIRDAHSEDGLISNVSTYKHKERVKSFEDKFNDAGWAGEVAEGNLGITDDGRVVVTDIGGHTSTKDGSVGIPPYPYPR